MTCSLAIVNGGVWTLGNIVLLTLLKIIIIITSRKSEKSTGIRLEQPSEWRAPLGRRGWTNSDRYERPLDSPPPTSTQRLPWSQESLGDSKAARNMKPCLWIFNGTLHIESNVNLAALDWTHQINEIFVESEVQQSNKLQVKSYSIGLHGFTTAP